MLIRLILAAAICGSSGFVLSSTSQEKQKSKQAEGKQPAIEPLTAMQRFGVLVGDWKGIGLPKRSSRRGAWTEKAGWVWQFPKGKPATLVLGSKKGKLVRQLSLGFDEKAQQYFAVTRLADVKQPRTLTAPVGGDAKKVVFNEPTSPKADSGEGTKGDDKPAEKYRLTLRILNENRVLLLVERGATRFRRLAEIGYTRAGSSIVTRKAGGPECVVTGGAGTIRVSHKGKTYFVCCSGCKQAFEDDPEGVLADYKARLAAEKAKRAKSAGAGR